MLSIREALPSEVQTKVFRVLHNTGAVYFKSGHFDLVGFGCMSEKPLIIPKLGCRVVQQITTIHSAKRRPDSWENISIHIAMLHTTQ